MKSDPEGPHITFPRVELVFSSFGQGLRMAHIFLYCFFIEVSIFSKIYYCRMDIKVSISFLSGIGGTIVEVLEGKPIVLDHGKV